MYDKILKTKGKGDLPMNRVGTYLFVYQDGTTENIWYKINMPLFYRIAIFTSIKMSYQILVSEFYDELGDELNEKTRRLLPKTRESIKTSKTNCGKTGGMWLFY